MNQDKVVAFDLPAVARKKVSVGFDGGQMSSDAGVLLQRGVERQLGLARRLAECVTDRRDRLVEGAARIRIFLPSACPEAATFRRLALRSAAAP